jgi:hypothetical protein
MVISKVFNLVGAGMGWGLTLAARDRSDWDWSYPACLTFLTSVAYVGIGDAMASRFGRPFGRHHGLEGRQERRGQCRVYRGGGHRLCHCEVGDRELCFCCRGELESGGQRSEQNCF